MTGFFQTMIRNGKRLGGGLLGLVVGQGIYLIAKIFFPEGAAGFLELMESIGVDLTFYSSLAPGEPVWSGLNLTLSGLLGLIIGLLVAGYRK